MANVPTRLSMPDRLVWPLNASQTETLDKEVQELYEQLNALIATVIALQNTVSAISTGSSAIVQGFPSGITVDEIDGLVGEIGHGVPGPIGPQGQPGNNIAMPLPPLEPEDPELPMMIDYRSVLTVDALPGTKVYYVSDTSGGAVTRKLTFTNGILTAEV